MKKIDCKKFVKLFCILISFIVVSFLVELLLFNFSVLKLNKSEKNIIDVNNYTIIKKDKTIKFDIEKKYVNKLKISYKSKNDIKMNLEYESFNYYNKKQKKQVSDVFDNEVNLQVININSRCKNVVITFDSFDGMEIEKIYIDNQISINYFRVVFMFNTMLLILIIYSFYKKGSPTKKIHKYFFISGLILGWTLIFLQPTSTFYSYDDQIHFKNTYELIGSSFNWNESEYAMVDGHGVGRDSISSIEEQVNQKKFLNKNKKTNFITTSGRFIEYNQVSYLPGSIIYHLLKYFGVPFSILFKFTKLINLIIYLCIFGYAIKITKIGKRLLTVIGLIPSSLFLASQFSYDSAVISGLTLGIVILMNWFVDQNFKVNFKNLAIFLFAMLYANFTKAIYVPFLFLFLFIPHEKFENKKDEIWIKTMMVILSLLILATFALPSTILSTNEGDLRGGATNVSAQFRLILSHPLSYAMVLKDNALLFFSDRLIGNYALGGFGYINYISGNLYYFTLLFMFFVAFTDTEKNFLSRKQKILFVLCSILTIIVIWTALYLSFTPVKSISINGVQPRYFIPMIFPILIGFQVNKISCKISEKKYNSMVLFVMSMIFLILLYQFILLRYCM